MEVKEYLEFCRLKLNELKANNDLYGIVIGNESADLDSIASSITYSYLKYKTTNRIYLPIINSQMDIIKWKYEILYVFDSVVHVADLSQLIFLNEIQSDLIVNRINEIILVDHNIVDVKLQDPFSHKPIDLTKRIVEIIDHRVDSHLYTDTCRLRIIDSSYASNCFLIAKLFQTDLLTSTFSSLMLTAILIDTNNMNPTREKQTENDNGLYECLRTSSGLSETNTLYEQINERKMDNTDKPIGMLMKLDYKKWSICGSIDYGMSSIHNARINDFKSNLNDEILNFTQSQSIPVYVILSVYQTDDKTFKRDLLFYAKPNELLDAFASESSDLKLIEKFNQNLYLFEPLDAKKTRKYWQPCLNEFLLKHKELLRIE